MNNPEYRKSEFDSSTLIGFLWVNRKTILVVTIATVILSSVVSLMIDSKYKSTVILFPTTTNSISKALLAENPGSKSDILEFGQEEEAEQMLQVLKSDEIKNRIIKKYNLFQHYDIDSTGKYPMTELYEEFDNNINFKRTEFMSVQIDVLDKDPQKAADIANDIAALLDSTKNRMQRERAEMAFKIVEKTYFDLQTEIHAKEDSLNKLRELGINDYESQSEVLNDAYAQALVQGKTSAIKPLQEKLQLLSKYGGAYVSLRDDLELLKKSLSNIKSRYEDAKTDAQQALPHKFIVNKGFKAEKKSYPVRWLIVFVATLSAIILTILLLIIADRARSLKDNSLSHE